jgi:signal transduction histidine kinase/ActR/RegA family two-component response regulator
MLSKIAQTLVVNDTHLSSGGETVRCQALAKPSCPRGKQRVPFRTATNESRIDFLQAVVDTLAQPVFVKNSALEFIWANRAMRTLLATIKGIELSPDAHITDRDVFPPEKVAEFEALERRVLAGETVTHDERRGDQMISQALLAPITLPDSSSGVLGVLNDVTAFRAAEAKATAMEEEATSKTQFLANMSHEIRTPLNGVLGMAQALTQDNLTPSQQAIVNIMMESGRTLLGVVNDILDLTKITTGHLAITPVETDLRPHLQAVVDLFRPKAEDKGLKLDLIIASDLPRRLLVDRVRTRQCVNNLLSNAIKFTEHGRIIVSCRPATGVDGVRLIEIEVIDTGAGMSEGQIAGLFGDFGQVDESSTRKIGGAGLGLGLARRLARMMDGEITVSSRLGKGSIFRLRLPLRETGEAAESSAPAPRQRCLRGARALLVDDVAINRRVVQMFLAQYGLEITEAVNGAEALNALANSQFDLILMDVHMPVMDGVEATRRIRASGQAWSDLPIIMLTADAVAGDRERYLALGADDYVLKPIDQRELLAAMSTALQTHADRQAA